MEVKELNLFIDGMYKRKTRVDELKADLKEENGALEADKRKMIEHLEEAEIDKYSHRMGTLYVQNKFSAKVPKDEEAKTKLFNWLRKKKIHMQYLTVNSTSLNALYKAELAASGPEFEMPGVEEPQVYQVLAMRSK